MQEKKKSYTNFKFTVNHYLMLTKMYIFKTEIKCVRECVRDWSDLIDILPRIFLISSLAWCWNKNIFANILYNYNFRKKNTVPVFV